MTSSMQPPGWYTADGDPPGTVRYWDGGQWVGNPTVLADNAPTHAGGGPSTIGGHELADPFLRVAARFLDGLIVFFAGLFFSIGLGLLLGSRSGFDSVSPLTAPAAGILAAIAGTMVTFLWEALWVHFRGGTPMKLLFGLRVVSADGSSDLGNKAFVRSLNHLIGLAGIVPILGFFIGWLVPVVIALVSLVMLFADERNRTIMDLVGGTVVVAHQQGTS